MAGGEGGGYSLKWPIRRGSPERGTFFRLQVYERVGISLFEVYESREICHLGL